MLVDQRRDSERGGKESQTAQPNSVSPLPRDYALLKLLFLPQALTIRRELDGTVSWRLARDGEAGITIRPEPRILPMLRAGRIGEACRIAAQRLRVSGLPPMPGPLPTGVMRDDSWSEWSAGPHRAQRLAAALMIPILSNSVNRLVHLVCRHESAAVETLAVSAQGESE
jgi:CRISPR-associated protein Csx17